ncbi:MAG: metalloprotease PmbA [Gammaproteobacteria bacterium]
MNNAKAAAESPLEPADRTRAIALVGEALAAAHAAGASSAEADLGLARGLSVTVRMGSVDTIEHHRSNGLSITAYVGQRKGSATTNDLRPEVVRQTAAAACSIARYASQDDCAGLVDPRHLASALPDLDLHHPWALDTQAAMALATQAEAAALGLDPRIGNSDGASVSSIEALHAYANSHGLACAWPATRHAIACRAIAGPQDAMQRDAWYSAARRAGDLEPAEAVGRRAAQRALRRLGARKPSTARLPVIFEAPVAASLFSHLLGAISGGAQYRQASFLLGALGNPVCAAWLDLREEPHLPRAAGSAPIDADGVATRAQPIVENGRLATYLLGAYSARKLGMAPTGNAGGVHNLVVPTGRDDLQALIGAQARAVLVTELLGFGVNATTGDYSRGASGFMIENGAISHPIAEFTIAGNLRDMLMGITAIGADVDTRGNIRTGSVLLQEMTIAGT